MINNISYFWIKFYNTAPWQIVKFYTENGKEYIFALDWMAPSLLENFNKSNNTYIKGNEIKVPNE